MEDVEVLKQELLEKISGINDYEILHVLREDIEIYVNRQKTEGPYDFPGATEEERAEMTRIINDEDDYVTEEEYQRLMQRWLTELSTKSVI